MNLCPAQSFDIDSIMMIERGAFIPQIQEKQKIFEERLKIFANGFFVLADTSEEIILKNKKALVAGYFSSEIWNYVPGDDNFFALNHSPSKTHNKNGKVLYVSSFALLPQYKGLGHGKKLFESSLKTICTSFPQLETVLLLVNEQWTSAKKIYSALGFKILRTIKDFFPTLTNTTSDGILMTCPATNFRTL